MATIFELANLSAIAYDSAVATFQNWRLIDRVGQASGKGFYSELYANDKTREVVMAIRGTDFDTKDTEDFVADIQLAIARSPVQFETAKKAYLKFKSTADRRYNSNYKGYLTGHSLGGGLASLVSAYRSGISTVTFNAPGMQRSFVGGQVINLIGYLKLHYLNTSQMLHIRATGDVISVGTGKHMGKVEEIYVDKWGDDKIFGVSRHLAQHSIVNMVESMKTKFWYHRDLVGKQGWNVRLFE